MARKSTYADSTYMIAIVAYTDHHRQIKVTCDCLQQGPESKCRQGAIISKEYGLAHYMIAIYHITRYLTCRC